ncbi:palmitoleoyl-protein carboxylesterase notum2-like [Spea bombifrons]|uniref:palmitoleoyl-protein carboxylesterase notum2-like n=1 Tax=Spea bombifrons TaxID=233779 RepID=UPI0023495897|nr:palmitoleoyl-protein carboxylesterase notum2-like [Spea bombifrons]
MRTILKSFLILMILTEAMCQSKRDKKMKKRVPGRNRKSQHPIKDGYVVIGQVPSFPLSSVGHPLFQTGDPTSVPQHNQRSPEDMKLHFVKNTLVTCNDGTTAGYYLREAKGSKRWIIFLEGGWCCYSKETCDFRYKNARRLMSSSEWPPTRKGSGVLSPKQHENPHWWNLNAVFVPYCSSDVWSGNVSKSHNDYAFMGSIIIQEVIRDLVPKGIKHAKVIILAGSSAGGTGVLVNVDRVATLMEELTADTVQVRGLVDSGWFIEPKKRQQSDCLDGTACAVTDAIKNGLRLWNGILPEKCKQQYTSEDEWQCFYGPKLYTSMKSPIFVVQWLYDEEQLRIENIQPEFQSMNVNQWNNIQNIGQELKKSLHNIPAVFAPACFSHTLITKSNWLEFQVQSVSLARALHCWEKSLQEKKGQKAGTRACSFHLIDTCEWPHCNPTCPAIHNRVSGKEIDMLQMVLRLGIDNQGKGQSKGELSRLMAMLRNGG